MSELTLEIDLDDGLPAVKVEKVAKPQKASERTPLRFKAPDFVQITSVPVGVAISVAPITCLGCGSSHTDHRGIFVRNALSNGVTDLKRISMRELPIYANLPRQVDMAPREVVPLCIDCFLVEKTFREAVSLAAAQPDLFGSPGDSKPVAEIAQELRRMHDEPEELEVADVPQIKIDEDEIAP